MTGGESAADLGWRKSSWCASGDCVELASVPGGVLLRNSTQPAGAVVAYTNDEWKAFLLGAKAGEFDVA